MSPVARSLRTRPEPQPYTGCALAAGASVAVGSSVAALSLLAAFPALHGQGIRYLLGAAILLALSRGRIPRLSWRDVPHVLALAATGMAGFNILMLLALRYTDPGLVGAVLGGVPLVLALAGPLLAGRLPSQRVVAGAALIVAGTAALQLTSPDGSLLGVGLALAAMLCEVLFTVLALPLLSRLGPRGVATYGSGAAALLLLGAAAVTDVDSLLTVPTAAEAAALVYLAAIVTAAAFSMWYASLDHIPVDVAGLFPGLIPVTALLASAVVRTETITTIKLAGALTVGAGIVMGLSAGRHRTRLPRTVPARGRPPGA